MAGPTHEETDCYCDLWKTDAQALIDEDVPEGYCGLCSICGRPGHIRHYPGSSPYTGSWCDAHYAAVASGFNPIVLGLNILLIALVLGLGWLVYAWVFSR